MIVIDGRVDIEKLPIQIQHHAHIEHVNVIDQLFQLNRRAKRGAKQARGVRRLDPANVVLRVAAGLLERVQLDDVHSEQLNGLESVDDGLVGSRV